MSPVPEQQPDYLRSLMSTARKHPGLWVVPLMSAVLIAVLMAFLGPKKWDATQSFVVREELIGRIVGPGRFDSLDAMKTAQEVIQETARRGSVLSRVLQANGKDKPSPSDVESLQEAVTFHAPGGGELGKTEILTMKVKSSSPERAVALVTSLFAETRSEIRAVRSRKADSMVREANAAVELANERMTETSGKIREIESSVGGDLAELRGLNEPYSGGGELRRDVGEIQREIREARSAEQEANQLIEYLEGVDPDSLLATPRELLVSQPALSELKNRLIEAQVVRSNAGGVYSVKHPRYQAKANSVVDIRHQINSELASVVVGLKSQRGLAKQRADALVERISDIEARIAKLASMRVDYGQLVTELTLRNEELRAANKELMQAESILRASKDVDLVSPLDAAQAGIRPLGPGSKAIFLGACLAGLLIGLGLIMMVTPSPNLMPPTNPGNGGGNGGGPGHGGPQSGHARQTQAAPVQSRGTTPGFVIPDLGGGSTMTNTPVN